MKKYLSKAVMLSVLILAVSFTASAQIYVKIRPVAPVIVRSAPPSPHHVWIDEEWEPRGGQYVYVGGHWANPPHRGWIWVPGHWNREGRGEWWVRGRWRHR